MPADPSWLYEFRPFSTAHLVAVGTSVVVMGALVMAGLRLRATPAERRFRAAWRWSILVFHLFVALWWFLPGNYDPQRSIPLNLCRLAAFAAGVAMLSPWRWPRALLYFWGIGLSTQAFITPVFPEGPAHAVFWVFWIGHIQIVGSALYDLVVRGYRPTAADFWLASVVLVAYTALVIPLNAAYGLNFAGLGPSTFDAPNLAKHLGPWPWRALWISIIVWAWLLVLWVVWRLPGVRERRITTAGAIDAR